MVNIMTNNQNVPQFSKFSGKWLFSLILFATLSYNYVLCLIRYCFIDIYITPTRDHLYRLISHRHPPYIQACTNRRGSRNSLGINIIHKTKFSRPIKQCRTFCPGNQEGQIVISSVRKHQHTLNDVKENKVCTPGQVKSAIFDAAM